MRNYHLFMYCILTVYSFYIFVTLYLLNDYFRHKRVLKHNYNILRKEK